MSIVTVTVFALSLSPFGLCANILGFFPVPSVSHQSVFQPIWKELSLRGHKVTVYTPNPLRDSSLTNLSEIDLSKYYQVGEREEVKSVIYKERSPFQKFSDLYETGVIHLEELLLQDPNVQKLLKDDSSTYDIIIIEPYIATFLALGNKFKCPIIAITSLDAFSVFYEHMGNPIHPLLYPDLTMDELNDLSLIQRIYNTLETLKIVAYYRFSLIPRMQKNIEKHFGRDLPPLIDIQRNISMFFVNSNPVLNIPRPRVPNVVQLGYMHIKPRKALPKDLQLFLDGAKEGVIYMSLGSYIKSAYLPKGTLEIFRDVFAELPYQVLWKFENGSTTDIPSNIYIKKWFPQQDVLGFVIRDSGSERFMDIIFVAHSNIKAFISHAGLQSTEEAIFYKVPIVAIPFFADQAYNARRIEYLGIGKYLSPWKLDKEKLMSAILEVIRNDKYRHKIAELSRVSQDQPTTGLERAVWWIEYVIRNKGAKHLRSPYLELPLYQSYFLDIIAFLILLSYLLYLPFKIFGKYLRSIYVCFISFSLYYTLSWLNWFGGFVSGGVSFKHEPHTHRPPISVIHGISAAVEKMVKEDLQLTSTE